MKTSKEMQLKIIEKMRENVENGNQPLAEIEYYSEGFGEWHQPGQITQYSFELYELRVKPETITINGVDVPKPLDVSEINPGGHYYFMPSLSANLCTAINGYDGQKFEYKLLYATKEEAIEASKLLFGIK